MAKLRQKISGGMRALTGAQHFVALRSYLATTAKHGIDGLDALTMLTTGNPWTPRTTSYLPQGWSARYNRATRAGPLLTARYAAAADVSDRRTPPPPQQGMSGASMMSGATAPCR